MADEITTARLARLFDTTPKTVADLAKRGIIVSAGKRGRWQLQPSVTGYVRHLRSEATARGGEAGQSARERLGKAQAILRRLAGELIEVSEVEAFWRSKLRQFRNRILAIGDRLRHLAAKDHARPRATCRAHRIG
jgi:phage terminase Nu1 subunit (DNA packaging protein)